MTGTPSSPRVSPSAPRAFSAPIGQTSHDSGTPARTSAGPRVRMIGASRVMAAKPEKVVKAMVTRAMTR